MQTLTIQLTLNFDHTETGFNDALQLLAFFIGQGKDLDSLCTYNKILKGLLICRANNTFPDNVLSRLNARLVSFHDDVLSLNGVR